MWIVQFNNGSHFSYLTGGNHGDPPRTLVKTSAKQYKTRAAAKAAVTRAINRNPHRDLSNFEIIEA